MRGSIERSRPWWVLAGTSVGLFMLMLDSTVVSLALPSIQRDLDASNTELQWVLNAYLLALAVLVVTAGRLGDIFGRRRVFLIGFLVFAAGALVGALTDDARLLIAARVVMATGGSAMLALSLALVTHVFPPEEQARALGIWTAVSSVALGIGPLVGGLLVELDWRLIFWINLPLAAIGIAITRAAAEEVRDETSAQRVDFPGLVVMTASLTAIVLALIEAEAWGWLAAPTLALLVGGGIGLWLFWRIEHRVRDPIVEFELFGNRPYLGATAAAFAAVGIFWPVIFYEPQFLQNVLDYSPTEAGLLILPVTVPMIVISPLAGRLVSAVGARATMTTGLGCAAVGVGLLTQIEASSSYGSLFPGLALFGIALGLVYTPMSVAAMTAMPKAKAGIASGVLAMNRVIAGAIALALVGALFHSLQDDKLEDELRADAPALDRTERRTLDGLLAGSDAAERRVADEPPQVADRIREGAGEAFAFALGNALWVLVGLAVLGGIVTWWLVPPRPPPDRQADAAGPAHLRALRARFHL